MIVVSKLDNTGEVHLFTAKTKLFQWMKDLNLIWFKKIENGILKDDPRALVRKDSINPTLESSIEYTLCYKPIIHRLKRVRKPKTEVSNQ